jgi:hypothetical protein
MSREADLCENKYGETVPLLEPSLQGMHPMIPVTTTTMQETFLFLPFESDSLMGSRISAGELLVLLNTFFMLFVMPIVHRE